MRAHVAVSIALVASLGVACTGGGDDTGDDSTGPDAGVSAKCMEATQHSDLAWIQSNVFSASCLFSDCHKGAATTAQGLNLEPGMAHAELVNMPSAVAPPRMLVVPGDPASSYLLVVLGQITGPLPEDGTMPLNSPLLCKEKRDAIERWIAAGALP